VKIRFAVAPPPGAFDADRMLAFATTAEALGFDTIWLSDVPLAPIGDPIVSLAGIATVTTTLKLGANIVPIGRNPMILATQLAQLDRLSEGRLLLSFVPGIDQPGERAALGFPTGNRWTAIETDIELMRRWWAGEAVDFDDGHLRFDHLGVGPTPLQDPLEIWLGGAGPRALERVAHCADGWLTANVTPEEAGRGRATIMARAAQIGRTIDEEHHGISIPFARHDIPAAAIATMKARRADGDIHDIAPIGADALIALIKRHVDVGLSKFVLRPLDPGRADDLTWLADTVLPLQT
jgi:probable F420-dependent oxidoreductase